MCFGAADNHCTHCFLTEGFFTLLFANSSSLCFKFFALNQKALFFFFFPKPKYYSQKWKRSAGAVLPGRFVGAVVPQLCSQHNVAQLWDTAPPSPPGPSGSSHSSLHPGTKVSISSCFSSLLPLCFQLLGRGCEGGGRTRPITSSIFRDPACPGGTG